MAQVVEDLRSGQLRAAYRAESRPEMSHSPVPRWDLIRFGDYVTMSVQFLRGCPFDCEFCDITAYERTRASRQNAPPVDRRIRRR